MLTLTMRPYTGDADLPKIADLLNLCARVDDLDCYASLDTLRIEYSEPSFNAAQNVRLWEDAHGELIGYAGLWLPESGEEQAGYFWFQVHPQARGDRLEAEMLHWANSRMQEEQQVRGIPMRLRSGAREHLTERRALLEHWGFTSDRCFLNMRRNLGSDQILPEPQLPPGFTVRTIETEEDVTAWVDLYNQSFIDHWNYHPLTLEDHRHGLTHPDYRSDLDLVAIAPDGTFAALCHCFIDTAENRQLGRQEGWIGQLGTRRGFRRMGLGRAMLLTGLHRLQAAGMEVARLGVDSENPNQALHLYESGGFHKQFAWFAYIRDVQVAKTP